MISKNKRIRRDANYSSRSLPNNNKFTIFSTKQKAAAAWVDLIQLGNQDIDAVNVVNEVEDDGAVHNLGFCSLSAVLEPGRPYTVGRSNRDAEFIFSDPRVSKQHCQILFDGSLKKLYLLNGALLFSPSVNCDDNNVDCLVNEFRRRLIVDKYKSIDISCCSSCTYSFKGSLNGVFVNGVMVGEGLAVELCVGDEVLLVCANRGGVCDAKSRIGFVVRRVVFDEELIVPGCDGFRFERPRLVRPMLAGKRVFALTVSDSESLSSDGDELVGRAKSLSARCNHILRSHDPVSCIRRCMDSRFSVGGPCFCISKEKRLLSFEPSGNGNVESPRKSLPLEEVAVLRRHPCEISPVKDVEGLGAAMEQWPNVMVSCETVTPSKPKADKSYPIGLAREIFNSISEKKPANSSERIYLDGKKLPLCGGHHNGSSKKLPPSPGKSFYLNRLEGMHQSSCGQDNVVSLPELLHPVDSILRMFIATFTSDIGWFLSYCDIPSHLPITLACHNTERCWSPDPVKRSCVPYPDFPNLVVVYPPFPESIAFGKDLKKKGVGCHHPKLLVLQREDCLRVIITSANLVAKQWKNVTNTIWWQDFPRREFPDCTSLFSQYSDNLTSDFEAQLAGFMASLVTDVPSQAYWIVELTKYDFAEASAYLVASVPGIHSRRSLSATLHASKSKGGDSILGSVEASVVGLSHRFRGAADSNGVRLKKLAAYLGQSFKKGYGMSEIILRREKNIPQDANAVSVLVSNPMEFSNGDCVQLGFLPRTVAKWVSPLWDFGFFRFHGYVCPREALAAASAESNSKVQLFLHVSQGPNVRDIPKMMEPEHVVAFCLLIASLQRCTGLWRLEEVLHKYKWPESLESDFIYGSSSIGTSVGAQFLAAFSAAAGKRSQQAYDSEESDPEWSCWNADHEMKHPSIRIIFPTIERAKNAHCGILPSKRLLCFSEKTWQRLKIIDLLHDAIPYPNDRAGYPMHVKVARRRFKSETEASSFGWVYCGSHNMSAAAWGRVISSQSGGPVGGLDRGNSLGSRLHVCNYELGLIFVFPPSEADSSLVKPPTLDNINLPFVTPAPRYGPRDRPATKRAMSDALAELAEQEGGTLTGTEELVEEVPDEEDEVEVVNYVAQEAEEEKAYADVLWDQVDSSQSS